MKSSTIKRSALSRETMDVIENITSEDLNSNQNFNDYDNTPEEYMREGNSSQRDSKMKEIDMLWQSFVPSRFNSSSPMMIFIGGILTGIISTIVVMFLFGAISNHNFSSNKIAEPQEATEVMEAGIAPDENADVVEDIQEVQQPEAVETAEVQTPNAVTSAPANMRKYTIKSGDTVEGIIKHFYGAYTPERAQAIMKANNLNNLDRISIDQVLLIPVEE